MRKVTAFIISITVVCLVISSTAFALTENEISSETSEQILLRLLFHSAHDAIEEYYGEPRQYWRDEILSAEKVPDTSYYKVVMQVETFYGPHNPPYGIETMTFFVSYGCVVLKNFKHQDEPG